MKNVKINFGNESIVEEVLNREILEEKINSLNYTKTYIQTYKEAKGYIFGGKAVTYINAQTGELNTYWISNNNYPHPFDGFKEIILCTISTPVEKFDGAEDILDLDQLEEYLKGLEYSDWDDLDEYTKLKGINVEECEIEAVENHAMNLDFDLENIKNQLDELYNMIIG